MFFSSEKIHNSFLQSSLLLYYIILYYIDNTAPMITSLDNSIWYTTASELTLILDDAHNVYTLF